MAKKEQETNEAVEQETNEVVVQESTTDLAVQNEILGFENEEAGDMLIPRIKVLQQLSPEVKDKLGDIGDIVIGLDPSTRLNGKSFIPVMMFKNNIRWIPRNQGGGIACMSRDNITGEDMKTGETLSCAKCRKNEFDNSKEGVEQIPTCTKYINFLGFIEGNMTPLILSLGKTNYKEGQQFYSLCKIQQQSMFNFKYSLHEKLVAKNGNEWYIITLKPAGKSSEDERAIGRAFYDNLRTSVTERVRYDDESPEEVRPTTDVNKTEF